MASKIPVFKSANGKGKGKAFPWTSIARDKKSHIPVKQNKKKAACLAEITVEDIVKVGGGGENELSAMDTMETTSTSSSAAMEAERNTNSLAYELARATGIPDPELVENAAGETQEEINAWLKNKGDALEVLESVLSEDEEVDEMTEPRAAAGRSATGDTPGQAQGVGTAPGGKWGSVSSDRDSGRYSSGLLSPHNGTDTQAAHKDTSYRRDTYYQTTDDDTQSQHSLGSLSHRLRGELDDYRPSRRGDMDRYRSASQDDLDRVDLTSPRSSISFHALWNSNTSNNTPRDDHPTEETPQGGQDSPVTPGNQGPTAGTPAPQSEALNEAEAMLSMQEEIVLESTVIQDPGVSTAGVSSAPESDDNVQLPTPSSLAAKVEKRERWEEAEGMEYATPSRLAAKVEAREREEDLENTGYATPSSLSAAVERRERLEEYEGMDGSTPSRLAAKVERREREEELDTLGYATPSSLAAKIEEQGEGNVHQAGSDSAVCGSPPSRRESSNLSGYSTSHESFCDPDGEHGSLTGSSCGELGRYIPQGPPQGEGSSAGSQTSGRSVNLSRMAYNDARYLKRIGSGTSDEDYTPGPKDRIPPRYRKNRSQEKSAAATTRESSSPGADTPATDLSHGSTTSTEAGGSMQDRGERLHRSSLKSASHRGTQPRRASVHFNESVASVTYELKSETDTTCNEMEQDGGSAGTTRGVGNVTNLRSNWLDTTTVLNDPDNDLRDDLTQKPRYDICVESTPAALIVSNISLDMLTLAQQVASAQSLPGSMSISTAGEFLLPASTAESSPRAPPSPLPEEAVPDDITPCLTPACKTSTARELGISSDYAGLSNRTIDPELVHQLRRMLSEPSARAQLPPEAVQFLPEEEEPGDAAGSEGSETTLEVERFLSSLIRLTIARIQHEEIWGEENVRPAGEESTAPGELSTQDQEEEVEVIETTTNAAIPSSSNSDEPADTVSSTTAAFPSKSPLIKFKAIDGASTGTLHQSQEWIQKMEDIHSITCAQQQCMPEPEEPERARREDCARRDLQISIDSIDAEFDNLSQRQRPRSRSLVPGCTPEEREDRDYLCSYSLASMDAGGSGRREMASLLDPDTSSESSAADMSNAIAAITAEEPGDNTNIGSGADSAKDDGITSKPEGEKAKIGGWIGPLPSFIPSNYSTQANPSSSPVSIPPAVLNQNFDFSGSDATSTYMSKVESMRHWDDISSQDHAKINIGNQLEHVPGGVSHCIMKTVSSGSDSSAACSSIEDTTGSGFQRGRRMSQADEYFRKVVTTSIPDSAELPDNASFIEDAESVAPTPPNTPSATTPRDSDSTLPDSSSRTQSFSVDSVPIPVPKPSEGKKNASQPELSRDALKEYEAKRLRYGSRLSLSSDDDEETLIAKWQAVLSFLDTYSVRTLSEFNADTSSSFQNHPPTTNRVDMVDTATSVSGLEPSASSLSAGKEMKLACSMERILERENLRNASVQVVPPILVDSLYKLLPHIEHDLSWDPVHDYYPPALTSSPLPVTSTPVSHSSPRHQDPAHFNTLQVLAPETYQLLTDLYNQWGPEAQSRDATSSIPLASEASRDVITDVSLVTDTDMFGGGLQTGSSQPSSRGASPTPEQVYGGSRKKGGGADARAFLVEKEVIESQLRKLQVENSSLRSENKLIKEKFNRAQSRIQHLENQLKSAHSEASYMHADLSDEVSAIKRQTRDRNEREREELQDQIVKLTKQLEMVKAENLSLEKQLDRSGAASDLVASSDRSRIIEGYRVETQALRDEMDRVKQLLSQAERDRMAEVDKYKEASAQVVKLTEVKALLQQQLENSGAGTVAEKQVKSIERRLKITEDRLHQERADRAGKLSEMEEKLINENARLQVSEKELRRQLQREKDRHKNVETKYRDAREENEKLRVQLDEQPRTHDNSYQSRLVTIRSSQKLSDEVKSILDELKDNENINVEQDYNEAIWLLWHQKLELSRQLKDWEFSLDALKVEPENIKASLQTIFQESSSLEEKVQRYKDNYEDVSKEKSELENTLKHQLKEIVSEKHSAQARVKNLEDLNAAVQGENDSLQASLRMAYGLSPNKMGEVNTWEAQVESLKSDLSTARGSLQASVRSRQQAEGEVTSLRQQLQGKSEALEEALRELDRLSSQAAQSSRDQHKATKIEKLTAEVRGLQAEVSLWQEKHGSVSRERGALEEQVSSLTKQLSRARQGPEGRGYPSSRQDFEVTESELQEKETQIMKLTVQYNETENELQRTKQLLLLQQQHNDELVTQMDNLQTQLRHRTRTAEKMSSAENEFQVELRTLKENLSTVNSELAEKLNELKMCRVEQDRLVYKVEKLEEDRAYQEKVISQNIAELVKSGQLSSELYPELAAVTSSTDTLTDAETKLRLVQLDKQKFQHDLEHARQTIDGLVQENQELVTKARDLHQELVKERAMVCQLTSEKVEAQEQLHIAAEERDGAYREKELLTATVNKHETHTADVIRKLQNESARAGLDNDPNYHNLDKDGKKLAIELATVKRLLEAREKEVDLLRDTIQHQKQEINTYHQKLVVSKEELMASQDNVERLTTDITSKMKEKAITSEVSSILDSSERARREVERYQRDKDRGMENAELERRAQEVAQLNTKLERSYDKQRETESQLHQKDTRLVAVETELKHVNQTLSVMQGERAEMKLQAERLNHEIRSLACLNSSLEQRLNNEKSESNRTHLKEELNHALQQVQMMRREHDFIKGASHAEKSNIDSLKEKHQADEEKIFRLEDRLRTRELEIDTLNSHLKEARTSADQAKQDKQTLYLDVQDLCRKLSEKDEKIAKLQERCNETVESIQNEAKSDRTVLAQEKQRLEHDVIRLKEEMLEYKDRLREKEREVVTFTQTTQLLENQTKTREELALKVTELEGVLAEARRTITALQSDNARLLEHSKHIQEVLDKTRETNLSLKEQLRIEKDQLKKQLAEAKSALSEKTRAADFDKVELQDQLNQALAQNKADQVSLAAVNETKESLYASNKKLDKSVESLKNQLHEEVTARKLAEQRADSVQQYLDEVKCKKTGVSERTVELQSQLARLEAELSQEKARYRKSKQELTDVQNTSFTHETHAQNLHLQLTETQSELNALRSRVETLTQTLSSEKRKYTLEIKQKMESHDTERSKLLQQSQQLTVDLDSARAAVATKNRENLVLQEKVLALEEKERDLSRTVKLTSERAKFESDNRESLDKRNTELEMLLGKLRNKDSSDADIESTKAEVRRMLNDLKQKVQEQIEKQRGGSAEEKLKDLRKIEELSRKVSHLEAQLGQEQALHIVTKTSLSNLEEDNQRLRQQLHTLRRRKATDDKDRSKSRMEEINEIIARSQTRAQALIASGAVGEETMRALSPTPFTGSPGGTSYSPGTSAYLATLSLSPGRQNTTTDILLNGSPTH